MGIVGADGHNSIVIKILKLRSSSITDLQKGLSCFPFPPMSSVAPEPNGTKKVLRLHLSIKKMQNDVLAGPLNIANFWSFNSMYKREPYINPKLVLRITDKLKPPQRDTNGTKHTVLQYKQQHHRDSNYRRYLS